MTRGDRFISLVGPLRIITAIGGLFVLFAVGRSILIVAGGGPVGAALDEFILIGGPGVGLLYGRYWLSRSEIRPDTYSRVAAWCLGGAGAMFVILALIELNPAGGIDRPLFTPFIALALGSVGGFVIGVHESRAVSRAREAEEHRDQFRAERDLRERIVETSPVGIVIVNADRSMRIVNERAAEIVGLSRDKLLDLEYDETMLEVTDSDGNPLEEGVFEQVLRTGAAVYDAAREMTRPDGQRIWLSVNGSPLRDRSGEITAVIFAFQDITEGKEREQQLAESNERLEQFAYAASHDLQEPLRMVSSYLQLIERRYGEAFDEEGEEYLEFAVDGADRMRNMIAGLLQYSRVETGGDEFGPVDLETVLEDVHEDLQVKIEETDAEITAESLPRVVGDEEQLRQVFQNLINNAIEYSGDAQPRIRIAAERNGTEWTVSVSDEGTGIDPADQERIFEVFQRGHGRRDGSGIGIGLALCERIIERHRGTIWVDSEPGQGATFSFTLPAARDSDA